MFYPIFLYEIRNGLRKPSVYIFFGLFFSFLLFLALVSSGIIPLAEGDSLTNINSAYSISNILIGTNSDVLGLINSIILISILGTAIQKDYQYNFHPLLFTKPITKTGYFFGRFLGALVIAIFVFLGPILGYFLGTLISYGRPNVGDIELINYIQPYLLFVIPNIILQGIIFFSLTTFLRSTLPAYLFAIIIFLLQTISGSLLANIDNKALSSMIDLTGYRAFNQMTEYWSPSQQNEYLIPFKGAILKNRILWVSISLIVCAISFWRFKFSQFLQPLQIFKRHKKHKGEIWVSNTHTLADLPSPTISYSWKDQIKQLWYLTKIEFRKIIRSTFFIITCCLGLAFVIIISQFMDSMYDVPTYPVTYQIVDILMGSFMLFVIIFLVFYSGTMIWRDREHKVDEIVGTTPINNSILFISKYGALLFSILVIMLLASLTGITIQLSKGFYDIDYAQYIVMILLAGAIFGVTALISMAVQSIMPNKYLGYFVALIPILILNIVFSLIQWKNPLILFNGNGGTLPYSDMNGYGDNWFSWSIFRAYWWSFALLISIIGIRLYARGKEKSIRGRWRLNKLKNNKWQLATVSLLMLIFLSVGAYIFYQKRVLESHYTSKEIQKMAADFEKTYKPYKNVVQPRIKKVRMLVDIYPSTKSMKASATYTLANVSSHPIDTIFINYNGGEKSKYDYTILSLDKDADILKNDQKNGVKIVKLKSPLLPGDSVILNMELHYRQLSKLDASETMIVGNGTFLNSSSFVSIGYPESIELSSNKAREKYGLKHKPRMASIDDTLAVKNNYISNDADWIDFETIVSTEKGQIAIAPGYLQKKWTTNNRVYYHYKMDSPILNFYAFQSANYSVKRDKWHDVNIEIYYQKGHEYNIDRMIKSIKKSLDYFTANFSPYQHKQVRIIEFPRYASFAQSFPNTIPYSESIGFITRVSNDPDKIDIPFYITSHEVAHQWWAHQVIGGNVQGSVLMSETLSQYAALMVMEKEYGRTAMKKFLQYELDKYLRGRTFETKKELPMMLVENQGYIHYNKGSLVMYALKDYLGEEVLNGAIRNYLNAYKFKGSPYSTSKDLINEIRKVTPDSLQYLITDLFEQITIYENYAKNMKVEKTADNKYKVEMTVVSAKYHADEKGKDIKVPVDDYIDVGIFGENKTNGEPNELLLQKVKMDSQEKTFVFTVSEKPFSIGIDPYFKLIDRTPKNNTLKLGETAPNVDLSTKKSKNIQIEF